MEGIPRISFTEYSLENGLRVVLAPSRRIPLVHMSLHYRVGSSYERPGLSGFAHLFEHMMFQGSARVGKNEHGRHIDNAGGRWNASTSKDRTNYYETVPAHFLELALWLEADRMSSLAVNEENFENQRQTVIEEKKQSYDNQPYGLSFLRFDDLAYTNWAYAHPIIGSVDDLEKAGVDDARMFHRTFYGPGNAILVLAGDLIERDALEAVRRHFAPIPDETAAMEPDLLEPEQTAERFETMVDPLAVLPAVALGYHMPPLDTTDYYALSMLALILADGDSSRFYRRFVYDNNWITGLYAGPNQYRGPELFRIWFQVQQAVTTDRIVVAVDQELDRIRQTPIDGGELEKAGNKVRHRFVTRLSKVAQVGELLAQSASLLGDPGAVNLQLEKYLSVTPEEISEAARRTFRRENLTMILVEPGKPA